MCAPTMRPGPPPAPMPASIAVPPGAAPELADYAALFPARRILEDFAWAARPTAERPLLTHQPRQLAWIEEHDARRPSLGAGGGLASAEQVSAL